MPTVVGKIGQAKCPYCQKEHPLYKLSDGKILNKCPICDADTINPNQPNNKIDRYIKTIHNLVLRRKRNVKPQVSIVFPVRNQLIFTAEAIVSILENTPNPIEIIVVDNGSDAETRNFFQVLKASPFIQTIRNETNSGFAQAINQGVARSTGKYVLITNNDIKTGANWLDSLLAKASPSTIVGACGETLDKATYMGQSTVRDDKSPFDYLAGWCMLMERRIFDALGGLDEVFGLGFGEDSDFCLRARKKGYKLAYASDCKIEHYGSRTFRAMMSEIDSLSIAYINSMLVKMRHHFQPTDEFTIHIVRLAGIGDVLCTLPLLKGLKQKFPKCKIAYTTWEQSEEAVNNCPYIDRLFITPNKTEPPNYDYIACDVFLRPTYEYVPRKYAETMAKQVGLDLKQEDIQLEYRTRSDEFAKNLLAGQPTIVFHTGMTWKVREWDSAKFKTVVEYCKSKGYLTVQVGKIATEPIDCEINLVGHTTFDQLASVIKASKLLVCIDSVCLHIAKAVGTPTVCLYGCTLPENVETKGKSYPIVAQIPCAGCRNVPKGILSVSCDCQRGDIECMKLITPDMVISRINEALK